MWQYHVSFLCQRQLPRRYELIMGYTPFSDEGQVDSTKTIFRNIVDPGYRYVPCPICCPHRDKPWPHFVCERLCARGERRRCAFARAQQVQFCSEHPEGFARLRARLALSQPCGASGIPGDDLKHGSNHVGVLMSACESSEDAPCKWAAAWLLLPIAPLCFNRYGAADAGPGWRAVCEAARVNPQIEFFLACAFAG